MIPVAPRVRWLAVLLCAAATALGACTRSDPQPDQPAGPGVPPERLALLARGVNLSHWIWLPRGKTPQERGAFIGPADVALLKGAGISHVRLPFEPQAVWDESTHALKGPGLSELRACMGTFLDGGLAVVVDAHANDLGWAMPDASGRAEELERFWSALAAELAGTDPQRVFLEILNEPHGVKNPAAWAKAQERVVQVIRATAPAHTIIVTGDDWGGIDGLKALAPLADRNVVYSFHFYEPHVFTHQGASWGWPPWKHINGLAYPSNPGNVETVAAGIVSGDEEPRKAADAVRQYGKENWNAKRIQARLDDAARWGRRHQVALYCGEFGAFKTYSPREARLEWIRDTRSEMEARGVGWAMWDYCGGFDLAEGAPGSRRLDDGVARALGLRE